MPIYRFTCPLHGDFKRLMSVEAFKESRGFSLCKIPVCSAVAEHSPTAPTAQAMEVLDDGIRPVKIERLADAERIFQERAEKHKQQYEQTDDQQEEE